MDLFELSKNKQDSNSPLAYRMRPRTLNEIIGQQHLLDKNSPLRLLIEKDKLHSFIIYGPPGSGKTTIASIISKETNAHFEYIKAVTSGVADIRSIAKDAHDRLKYYQQKTIVFLDEIHRFNKSQQDVLLPYVEDGTLILIGATTENPLYELNNALLSRMKIYITEPLTNDDIKDILLNTLNDKERGLGNITIDIAPDALEAIVRTCRGDARIALNIIDTLVNSFSNNDSIKIDLQLVEKVLGRPLLRYDKKGDYHYDTISAFIKSIRGSDPDAAIFWLAVMLESGEDPEFIARRLIVHASEDIGMADPNALVIATSAFQALQFVGLPEARIPLAQATIYLATAPKSNTSQASIDKAIKTVRDSTLIKVPNHIADSSHSKTSILGKGIGYKYPHSYGGYVKQQYLPDNLKNIEFYYPTTNGYEKHILTFLKSIKEK